MHERTTHQHQLQVSRVHLRFHKQCDLTNVQYFKKSNKDASSTSESFNYEYKTNLLPSPHKLRFINT